MKKFTKIGRVIATLAVAAIALSGCAAADSGNGGDKAVKIGATFPVLDAFLQKVADGISAEAEAKGATVDIVAADNKVDTQLSQVENFISQKVDAIIVIAVDTTAAGPMTEAAKAANIPLVYVNRNPSQAGVPYVGSQSLVSGTLEMEQLAKLAGGKGNVVVMEGEVTNEAALDRTKGCNDVVAKNPGMKVVKTGVANWDRAQGQALMENWLQSGVAFTVVCANNDEMALGAINALKAAGKKLGAGGILVGGVDANADALVSMEAGELATTVFQDASGQGAGGVDAALALIAGETVEDYVDVPYQLVTLDNIADFKG
ncbi:MAG: sugar ABC transporter substrate-binding protein [Actinomycetes bacterium]